MTQIREIHIYEATCNACGYTLRGETSLKSFEPHLLECGWVHTFIDNPRRKNFVFDDNYAPMPPAKIRVLVCRKCNLTMEGAENG